MRRRLVAVISVAAVVLVTTGALFVQQSSTAPAPSVTSQAGGGRQAPSAPGAESATPAPSAALPGSSSTAPPGVSTEARANDPDAAADPAPESPSPLPALVSLPLPDTSSAVGSVVAGFPDQVLPAAPQSSIASSSVAAEGSRLQAALVAQTPLTTQEVLDFYSATLTELGLVSAPVPAPDGSSALVFTRGVNTVTLTASPVASGSEYTVFGIFSAES
ncbi:hypothetical protein E3T61_19160 [Cryobacterium lactosi]|uniref:Uncharacterized protein n=1 Tax=Cryobacterium lactosi TaxID=1259202 RepID=A0A4R9BI37_9MICO|nr:hypothetical protein [Cryobacterium lactosi]TFD84574.1 hypothetical protein E3T61_19160 [Cryobacterium lactosi]